MFDIIVMFCALITVVLYLNRCVHDYEEISRAEGDSFTDYTRIKSVFKCKKCGKFKQQ
jgi:hypothetical protein